MKLVSGAKRLGTADYRMGKGIKMDEQQVGDTCYYLNLMSYKDRWWGPPSRADGGDDSHG